MQLMLHDSFAPTGVSVLISGESGVGKEVFRKSFTS